MGLKETAWLGVDRTWTGRGQGVDRTWTGRGQDVDRTDTAQDRGK
jgi:hypothetical protein